MMAPDRAPGSRDALPEDDAAAHARGSFFGRRKGHKLRFHQADLIENLLPLLALDISVPAPANLGELFEVPTGDVRLEIGFGGGEHLIAEALAFPDAGFIGCEPYVNGMAKILRQIEARNVGNIRYAGDAAERWHGRRRDRSPARPDPSRSAAEARAPEAALRADATNGDGRILKVGCEFRFVSDIDDYCAWTLAQLMRAPDFFWTAERARDWREPWPGYTMTRYGRKAEREGRVAAYLRFKRVG
jgi:tRNA (guanine-N7-)-methyltransferase